MSRPPSVIESRLGRVTVGAFLCAAVWACSNEPPSRTELQVPAGSSSVRPRPIGILGDSDSHSYHDRIRLPGADQRGGAFRATTFQWIELWHLLRPGEIDPGEWGVWGTRGRVAWLRRAATLQGRAPRKEDFRYNFAVSGARCAQLNEGMARQVDPLLDAMAEDPARWAGGIVFIRIGVNDFGQPESLERFATDTSVAPGREGILECVEHIARAVRSIRAGHPATRIVLVGIYNNVHWARTFERWNDVDQLGRIDAALDVFDDGLRALAAADANVVFHDDRTWIEAHWGGRSRADGTPAYRPFTLGTGAGAITNTVGDHPRNLVLADNHLGTAGNALWLRSVVDLIERTWALGLTPVSLEEVLQVTDPEGRFGLREGAAGPPGPGA